MAISPRIVRQRIKSVRGIRKITKAIELVSAAKMRRAVGAVLASRPYADAIDLAINNLTASVGEDESAHPLLQKRKGDRILCIAMFSDRGLCGGFNAQMARMLSAQAKTSGKPIDYVIVGKRGVGALRRIGANPVAVFSDFANQPKASDARTVADLAALEYQSGKYERVVIAYTDFRSALVQKPVTHTLLPIAAKDPMESDASASGGAKKNVLFEPSAQAILDAIIPRRIETRVYQAILESAASEHASRVATMRSATDSATDMIDGLNLIYNQARQSAITRELAEITAGKAAIAE